MGQGKLGNGHFGWRFSFDSLCFSFVAFFALLFLFSLLPRGHSGCFVFLALIFLQRSF
jgi:hypothetical protein